MDIESNSSKVHEGKQFHPGAARFGNFINYYNFNSVTKRNNAIPTDLMSNLERNDKVILCLDIGCNSGDLTIGLYSHLLSYIKANVEVFILGIDLDDILITRCNESNTHPNNIEFMHLDIMEETSSTQLQPFLDKHKRSEFDLVTCFSTTMWIHLNHGDSGLEGFLKKVSGITRFLMLEPQEWKSYRSAVRRMTRLNYEPFVLDIFKIRNISEHISNFLQKECYMNSGRCCGKTSWGRSLYLFHRKDICLTPD